MNLLEGTIKKIQEIKHDKTEDCQPIKGLGGLNEIYFRYLDVTKPKKPQPLKKAAVIACGDHGVCAMKVSAYPQETTIDMTANYLVSRGAVANAMAKFSQADMFVVDMGIAADMHLPSLIDRKIAKGTKNFAYGPAMTHQQARKAIEAGIEIADDLVRQGYNCFLLGEMGIANTTSSAAIAACICGLSARQATGRGTNISDARLQIKTKVVEKALIVNKPNAADGLDVLAKVGGFEFGGLAGVILGAAAHNCLIILDGFNTAAAALIAQLLCPASASHLLSSHLAGEPAHKSALAKLGLLPYLDLSLQLSETAGSSVIVRFIELAAKLYQLQHEGKLSKAQKDFTKLTMPQYELDEKIMALCQQRVDNLTKPIKCLGKFEDIAVFLAGVLGKVQPTMSDIREKEDSLLPYVYSISQCMKYSVSNTYAAQKVGMILIDGALHMLNDMKTFAEASVAVANDGPGFGRQKGR